MRISDWSSDVCSSDLFARIGVPSVRVDRDADADLRLIDEVAPYDSALWYLGRISCAYEMACSSEATARLSEAQQAQSIEDMLRKLDEAEVLTLAHGGYIRSEEHTSELPSLMRTSYAVFCLKKKHKQTQTKTQKPNNKPSN